MIEIKILYQKMSPTNIERAVSLCEEMILKDSQAIDCCNAAHEILVKTMIVHS